MLLRIVNSFCYLDNKAKLHLFRDSYARIMETAHAKILDSAPEIHYSLSTGELLKSVEQGAAVAWLTTQIFFTILPVLFDFLIAICYLWHMIDERAAVILTAAATLYCFTTVRSTSTKSALSRENAGKARAEAHILHQSLSHWQTITSFNRQAAEGELYAKAVQESRRAMIKEYEFGYWTNDVQKLFLHLGFIGAALVSLHYISKGEMPVGRFTMLLQYWDLIIKQLSTLRYEALDALEAIVESEKLTDICNQPTTQEEYSTTLTVSKGEVAFKGVSFSYSNRASCLRNVKFTVTPGYTTAIVGPSGSGKTTIFNLLLGYLNPTSGAIEVDGQDIRRVTRQSLRGSIGIVPQGGRLFNRSIRENVRYGRPEADDEEIKNACRALGLHDMIASLPHGYETVVEENGSNLSEGQAQRISIARVLLKRPKIVLFDEATSALDAETELMAEETLSRTFASSTIVIVAHRLSTIRHAQRILVMGEGRIVESGSHNELMELNGTYRHLWTLQQRRQTDDGTQSSATLLTDPAFTKKLRHKT